MNNMVLDSKGPLLKKLYKWMQFKAVLFKGQLFIPPAVGNLQMQRASSSYMWIFGCTGAGAPNCYVVQGSLLLELRP